VTTRENWFVSLVIRTGSKDTNLLLTTGAQKLGRKLNAYGCGVTGPDGTIIAADILPDGLPASLTGSLHLRRFALWGRRRNLASL
jgi:hypothetical protein